MPRNRRVLRMVALCYGALVAVTALWAWYIDIKLLHSEREHLLPDILLAFVSMPSSLAASWIYQNWPGSFVGLAQTAYLSVCALLQAGILFYLSLWWGRHDEA